MTAPEMIDGRARRASSTSSSRRAATSSRCFPTPPRCALALARIPSADPHGHRPVAADAGRPRARRCCCCRPRRATRTPAGSPRPRPSGGSSSAPRSPGRGSVPRDRSGRCSASWPRGCAPSSPTGSASPGPPRSARRSAEVVDLYRGIEDLREEGDSFQYGGPLLCDGWRFPPPTAGRTSPRRRSRSRSPTTAAWRCRPGGASSSTRWSSRPSDPLTGAGRDAVLISAADAERLGIADGGAVIVRSDFGELRGTALVAPIAAGNVQVHWPEANVLIQRDRLSPEARDPRLQRPGHR